MSPSALAGEPGARRVSPLLLLLVILSFFLVFAGVSCNTATTRSTIGSIEASQGVSAAETAQVNACIDGLSGVNILTYSGWQLAFGKDPVIGSVPAACNQSTAAATDTSAANIGPQLLAFLGLISIFLALLFATAGVLGLLAARTRALITAAFAAAAGVLLIVDQLHLRDVLHAKIASTEGSSAPGVLGIASLFNVNAGIGLVVAVAILAVAVLYNLAALIVPPAREAVPTPEPHPPPTLSPPPQASTQAEPPRNGMP